MGTVTVTINHINVDGRFQQRIGTVTMSSSYATGGDTITAASMAFDRCIMLDIGPAVNSSSTNNAFDLAAPSAVNGFQTGKVQAFGDGGNSPGGPLIEAANAANLSTVTANFIAWGF